MSSFRMFKESLEIVMTYHRLKRRNHSVTKHIDTINTHLNRQCKVMERCLIEEMAEYTPTHDRVLRSRSYPPKELKETIEGPSVKEEEEW